MARSKKEVPMHFKFWENASPEEFDLAFTFKGLIESLEGQIQLHKINGTQGTFTIQTLSDKEYKAELKKRK